MNATMDLMPCDVNELQYLSEQRELELQASEQAREKLEERIEQMELHQIGGARMPVNPKLVSQPVIACSWQCHTMTSCLAISIDQ